MSTPPPPPPVAPVTLQWYNMLPEVIRVADPLPGGSTDYPLLRYMDLVGAQLQAVIDLIDRIDFQSPLEGGTDTGSDLADPDAADLPWLPWLAQIVGVTLTGLEPEQTQRDAIRNASSGWQAGTKASIAAAAQTALTGTKYVSVRDHATSSGPGGEWDVLVLTRGIETPSDQAVIDAINAAHANPAGVKLWVGRTAASWDLLESRYTTSDAWDATGSWDAIESTI